MTIQLGANLYTQGFGSRPENVEVPHIDIRDPSSSDVNYPIGKRWINQAAGNEFTLLNFSSLGGTVTANWTLIGGGLTVDRVVGVDASTPPGTNPVTAATGGLITVTGAQVAAGTTTNVIRTDSLAANTWTVEVQRSQAVASSTIGDNGVSHFDSSDFIVDANGFVSLVGGTRNYTNVDTAASPYTVLASDYYISVDCSAGAVTLRFPNVPVAKQQWVVKDRTGSASTNNITITTVGGAVTIDGVTSYLLVSNYGAVDIIANATPTYEVF